MEGVHTAEVVIDNGSFGMHKIRFETGRLAKLAAGSAVVYLDDETMVLSATTASKKPKDNLDFFPLTVDVEERMYAAGRIPGSFFRREGRPSEDAILTCRLIDRPLRPSFVQGPAQRGPGRRDDHGAAPRAPVRRGRDQRRVAVHPAGRAAVLRPDRRRPGRADQGPVGRLPDPPAAGGRHLRHGRGRPGAGGRRRRDHDGRGRVHAEHAAAAGRLRVSGAVGPTEETVAEGLEAAKPFIKALCEAQQAIAAHAAKETAEYPVFAGLRAGRVRRRRRRGHRGAGARADDRGQAGARHRDRPGQGARQGEAGQPVRGPREGDQRRVPRADQEAGPAADHPRGHPHRRPRADRHPASCPPRSTCCRGCTAPRCSSAARPRCSASPR